MRAFLCGTGGLAATGSSSDGMLPPLQGRSLIRAQLKRSLVASLALLAGFSAASPAVGCGCVAPAGQRPVGCRVPEVARARAGCREGPVQVPSEKPLVDEVSEFVEVTVPDDQRYVFPTEDERRGSSAASSTPRLVSSVAPHAFCSRSSTTSSSSSIRVTRPGSCSSCSRSGSRGAGTGSSATGVPGGSTSSPRRRGCRCWRSRCLIRASRARDATRSAATAERTRWR